MTRTSQSQIPSQVRNDSSQVKEILTSEIIATLVYSGLARETAGNDDYSKFKEFKRNHQEAANYWQKQFSENTVSTNDDKNPVIDLKELSNQKERNSFIEKLKLDEMDELELYKEALNSTNLSPAQKSYIKTVLLPAQMENIHRLECMIAKARRGEERL